MITQPLKAVLWLIFISVSSTLLAASHDQARDWLERMALAMSQMNYQGTFVYVRSNVVESMRITHVVDEKGLRERIYSISGPSREIIRDQKGVRCILKDSKSVVRDPVIARSYFPELPLSAIDNPASAYQLTVRGNARIAGQNTRRISITPKDVFRYGYDFLLDEQTGLLLDWVLNDSNRRVLAKLMFTDIVFVSDVDRDELESDSDAEDFVEIKTLGPQKTVVTQSRPQWPPSDLPSGFRLISYSHKKGDVDVFEHMVYGDGRTAGSVDGEKQGGTQQIKQGSIQLGTNNAYSRQRDGLQLTVSGEGRASTVNTIAKKMVRSVTQ